MDYQLSTSWVVGLVVLAIWELVWKGLALWRAGQSRQAGWFIALLVLNTAGILPIVYLLLTRDDKHEKD